MLTRSHQGEGSVRAKLLVWLLVPLALVLLSTGYATYSSALDLATDAYDRSLLDPALAIATRIRLGSEGVEVDLPAAALEALRVDSSDRLYFSVSTAGRVLAGTELPPLPKALPEDSPLFYNAVHQGEPVRVAALGVPAVDGLVLVQAAETRVKRDRLAGQVLLAHTAFEVLALAVAFAAVWIGVGRGLAPVQRLRAEMAKRSDRDLRPLPAEQAPEEVRPLVQEMNQLLGRLAKSSGLQQRFIADAAHQLRTPLAALQAQAEAARREDLPAHLGQTVEQLEAATRRAAHLVRQLLTLASVEPSAGRPYQPRVANLAELAQQDLSSWIAQADARKIDLGFELRDAPVTGEPALLQEMIGNLLDNALKYAGAGSAVTLRTGQRPDGPFLEVQDNGPGIPEAERTLVFERFHRGSRTCAAGAGLGLPIVREIANLHGAELALEFPPEGGTRAAVRFPSAGDACAS